MHVGRSPEEQVLAGEERPARKGDKKGQIVVEIKVDREVDAHGNFFVAYVIRRGHPNDFQTFGSRARREALDLARTFANIKRYQISRVYDTSSADDDDVGGQVPEGVRGRVMTAYRDVAKRHSRVLAKLAK